MRTKDLIAKRLRREKAMERKNRNKQQVAQQRAATEMRDVEYTLPTGFSDEVLNEVKQLPNQSISQNEVMRRRDMRDVLTFTIDPDDAKDFDDALSLGYG